ncbi:Hypothetical predicted protein [Mytilus galloprovincialis]|uniref:Uncharacterized protein n=1 Tax=Mytilus galloprovincialis TaxID=29158 RepID=A0A8B6DNN6_MYTGA|nr:Hypothetical predicted protein [Mytilus galloprovincialis]
MDSSTKNLGAVVYLEIRYLGNQFSTVTDVFDTEKNKSTYIYLDPEKQESFQDTRKRSRVRKIKDFTYEKSVKHLPWIYTKKDNPKSLLKLARSSDQGLRCLGVKQLSKHHDWEDYQYRNIAQALDTRTMIGLARSQDVDPRFFLPMPKAPPSKVWLEDEYRTLISSLQNEDLDKCLKHFATKALQLGNNADERDSLFSFGGTGLEFAKSVSSVPEERVEIVCLQALASHSADFRCCQNIIKMGGVQLLQQTYTKRHKSIVIRRQIAKTLGNLSVHQCFNEEIVRAGSVEVILPVNVPGLSSTSKKDKEVCLYDEICVHFCGFIGSLPVKHFHKLEEVLIVNLLSTSPVCSQLATDAWCFLVRYGSAELCDSHVKLLLDIMKNIQGHTIQYRNVTVLVNRMIKFLAKEHQVDIIKLYPLSNHMTLWSALSISGFTSTNARSLVDDIVGHCVKNIHNFINTTEKKPDSFVFLISSIDCLLNIFNDSDVVEKYLLPNAQSTVVEKTVMICNSFSDWLILPITRLCLAKVIHLYSFILPNLNNKEILQILILISTVMTQRSDQYFKLSVAVFLQHLGSVKLSPSFEQSQILNKIPEIFSSLLSDTNSIIKHKALETFTKFAEITVHESIVPQCIQNDTNIQDSVVAFLNKTPFPSAVKRKDYLITLLNSTDEEDVSDERDDGGQEPSSKRPRTEDCGKSENQQQLIDLLLSCSQGLQENKDAIPNQLITRLKETRNLISSFLDEKG